MACLWQEEKELYDFIKFVGEEWMDGEEAVATDMNSDYQEIFEDCCPHIQVIRKNFNNKVVTEVRKDEQRRLYSEGRKGIQRCSRIPNTFSHLIDRPLGRRMIRLKKIGNLIQRARYLMEESKRKLEDATRSFMMYC